MAVRILTDVCFETPANRTTQRFVGHYGPVFNEYLEEQNALIQAGKLPGAHYIKLSTLLIGNGWYDPLIQCESAYLETAMRHPANVDRVYRRSLLQLFDLSRKHVSRVS